MLRLLTALLCALACHVLLFILPCSDNRDVPPRLQGEETIKVTLGGKIEVEAEQHKTELRGQEIQPPPAKEEMPQQSAGKQSRAESPVQLRSIKHKKQIRTRAVGQPSASAQTPSKTGAATTQTARPKTAKAGQSPTAATVKATPLYSSNPTPEYPPLARRRHWQGTVFLAVTVSAQGSAERVTIAKSSGYSLLDKAAMKTVKTWHFLPGREGERPVSMNIVIPVNFKLK